MIVGVRVENKVKNYASILEDSTREQAELTASLPFVQPYVALMPDAHVGFGVTVGSVVPTIGAVIPNAVGVDIGCGMIAIRTSLKSSDLPEKLGRLHGRLRADIPAGVGEQHEHERFVELLAPLGDLSVELSEKQIGTALRQLGTLGSGNHFVELCLDQNDTVWCVLHSGSRGIGNQLAKYHIDIAKAIAEKYMIPLPHPDLAYLPEGTLEFEAYWQDVQWAQNYARLNRDLMMKAFLNALSLEVTEPVLEHQRVDCHHNYIEREHHFGKDIFITRKGAIRARNTDWGIIPGSMGDSTFIVLGKGNAESMNSAPHGAGRLLSRGAAKRELDLGDLRDRMQGKVWNDRNAEALLDEHPSAYKPIEAVMADAEELVEPVYVLNQILNYKGA